MKDNRPVNLDIGSMRLPVTAWASISHRATGVALFVSMALLLWALDSSLSSPESFASVVDILSGGFAKLVLWGVLTVGIYHALAGVKHIVMDFGYGETMQGGVTGVRIIVALTIVLSLLAGIWIW